MAKKSTEIAANAADSLPINEIIDSNPVFTRREMLGIAGVTGVTALTGNVANALPKTMQARPRLAVLTTFWGAPGSHVDWIADKLMDGYWWQGAHKESRVDVVSAYIHQFDTSPLGQKVAQ